MWAFSEAALGGILHALKIPFTGLFIGGSAVIFISLIAYYSDSSKTILESAFKVILVKFVVSPYSPINAYFAVMLQSLLGYLLFYRGFNCISPFFLGFTALLLSAFQKIIILTVVFGMTLWESVDIFFKFIVNSFSSNEEIITDMSFSYILIGMYILSHIVGGLLAGWYSANLPSRLRQQHPDKLAEMHNGINDFINNKKGIKVKKNWWNKTSSIILLLFFVTLIGISFVFEEVENVVAVNILVMILRSLLIIVIWYYFISPYLLKIVNKVLIKKSKRRAEEIEDIVKFFPNIKQIVKYSWIKTDMYKGLRRIVIFIDKIFINYILFQNDNEELQN